MNKRVLLNHVAVPKLNPRSPGKVEKEMGTKIRLRRTDLGLSQTDLAAVLGVSFQQVQKYEKGVNRIGAGRLEQLAAALSVPVSFFFGGDAQDREIEGLIVKDARYSIRLLRAYAAIEDSTVRRQFVALMEQVAGTGR